MTETLCVSVVVCRCLQCMHLYDMVTLRVRHYTGASMASALLTKGLGYLCVCQGSIWSILMFNVCLLLMVLQDVFTLYGYWQPLFT